MPITRFLTFSILFANPANAPKPSLKESGSDAAIQLLQSARTVQPQFTLYGYVRNRALDLPDLEQHPQYDAATQSVTWSTELSAAENARLLTLLAAVSVPIMAHSLPGTDGTWYDLVVEQMAGRFHFRWWVQPPAGWESVGAVVAYLLALSQTTFQTSAQPRGVLAQTQAQVRKITKSLRR